MEGIPICLSLHKIKAGRNRNEDGNPNCEWKWITLRHEFESIGKAKEWLNENFERLNTQYKFPKLF